MAPLSFSFGRAVTFFHSFWKNKPHGFFQAFLALIAGFISVHFFRSTSFYSCSICLRVVVCLELNFLNFFKENSCFRSVCDLAWNWFCKWKEWLKNMTQLLHADSIWSSRMIFLHVPSVSSTCANLIVRFFHLIISPLQYSSSVSSCWQPALPLLFMAEGYQCSLVNEVPLGPALRLFMA